MAVALKAQAMSFQIYNKTSCQLNVIVNSGNYGSHVLLLSQNGQIRSLLISLQHKYIIANS